ncbi:MAG: hypothetical protein HS116_12365 [Planctomycetes bacterium]|nr:hypothetical protein [Planctomycetota bacterium]
MPPRQQTTQDAPPLAESDACALSALQERIPAALWAHLVALKPHLMRQGVVQFRAQHGRYRLRYRVYDADKGYAMHRSLAIGSDERVAFDIQQVLEAWRAPERAARAAAKAEQERRRDRRATIRLAQAVAGGGRSKRERISAEIRKALTGAPLKALSNLLGVMDAPAKKRGRPPKCRFW